ncbi:MULTISPECIES: hypothetical protein [unclassified Enterococcus]|uniref:hypothetical protein n=1 Tax=unclassified Enterococcus TaxID=2608891 RepID=UPI00201B3E60|nr:MULTISPECIES: hypothetical protein [unclassified Enterococcus]
MNNNFYTRNRQFDYLDYMNELDNLGRTKFLEKTFEEATQDIDIFLAKIKSLGLEIKPYSISNYNNPLLKYYNKIFSENVNNEIKEKMKSHIHQVNQLKNLFIESNKSINKEISMTNIDSKYIVPMFIIFLEHNLELFISDKNLDISMEQRITLYDSYISFSATILKYFFHNISMKEQSGINRIFSEKDLLWNINVYSKARERDNLMDAFEYWKYSKIEIENSEKKMLIDFIDEDFNRAVLVSNFRYKNYMKNVESDIVDYKIRSDRYFTKRLSEEELSIYLSETLCQRYLGEDNLNQMIFGIELNKWLDGIHFLQHEAMLYLKKKKNRNIFSVQNLCIVKTEFKWIKGLISFSKEIKREEAKTILGKLTFGEQSKDLIDAPLIKVQNQLILLPTLAKSIRPLSAVLSMFTRIEDEERKNQEDIALSFKGIEFEKRLKHLMKVSNNINANRLYIKMHKEEIEREIDLAFVLDDELFLVECKFFNQPYTVREHAKTNKKIKNSIKQLNKNADYFEQNIDIVIEQMNLKKDTLIKETHRILLTANILGEAGQQENILMIDEASFNAFLLRNPPTISNYNGNIQEKVYFNKGKMFTGKVTAEKLINFIKWQPSVKSMKNMINKALDSDGEIDYLCCQKNIESFFVGNDTKKNELLDKISGIYEELLSD